MNTCPSEEFSFNDLILIFAAQLAFFFLSAIQKETKKSPLCLESLKMFLLYTQK